MAAGCGRLPSSFGCMIHSAKGQDIGPDWVEQWSGWQRVADRGEVWGGEHFQVEWPGEVNQF